MAVGTGAITLQEVVDEIDGIQTSLQDCVDDAISGNYDPTYYTAPATSLAEFRGYETPTGVTVYQFTDLVTKNGAASASTACAGTFDWIYYSTNSGGTIANGEVVYSDSGGTTVLNGGNNYYSDGNDSFRISSIGVISSLTGCII